VVDVLGGMIEAWATFRDPIAMSRHDDCYVTT
jgi:hypothetical protein